MPPSPITASTLYSPIWLPTRGSLTLIAHSSVSDGSGLGVRRVLASLPRRRWVPAPPTQLSRIPTFNHHAPMCLSIGDRVHKKKPTARAPRPPPVLVSNNLTAADPRRPAGRILLLC